ncbi:MAG TPA: potassium channel family protein [Solirubrobacteraceae bacterium]|jgi:hypothetical protein|nr:potassium channel family protein [Solirubrobacteraceae bacterium]
MQPDDLPSPTSEGHPAGDPPATAPAVSTSVRAKAAEIRGRIVEPEVQIYAALLALIATVFAIEGIVTASDPIFVLLTAVLGVTTVLSLRVAHARRGALIVGAAIALALFLTTLVQSLTGGIDRGTVSVADALLVAIAPVAILTGVIRRLSATRAVTVEAVLGVVCVYLLIGMFFAFVYGAIDRIGTGHFFAQSVTATASRFQYYSFTTLATVGYGDLTSSSNLGHTLSVAEALLGQIYLVTVVSLIVGNLGRRRRDS